MNASSTRAESRPLPPASIANCFPPNRDHLYFQEAQLHPFRPHAKRFEPVNAWWLAEASLLAYADPDFAAVRFRQAGFQRVEFFCGQNTDCFVVHDDRSVVVAFRGTEWSDLRDFITDLKIRLVDSGQGGKVHQGFKEALEEVWEKQRLRPFLEELLARGEETRSVWFTGHSLGAALATLAAGRFPGAYALYTFGSPRVGDEEFQAAYPARAFRVVNHSDLVTRLPPDPPYVHVGQLHYIDSSGRVHNRTSHWHWRRENLRGRLNPLAEIAGRLRRGVRGGILDARVADHAPLFYAIHLWNHHARTSP